MRQSSKKALASMRMISADGFKYVFFIILALKTNRVYSFEYLGGGKHLSPAYPDYFIMTLRPLWI